LLRPTSIENWLELNAAAPGALRKTNNVRGHQPPPSHFPPFLPPHIFYPPFPLEVAPLIAARGSAWGLGSALAPPVGPGRTRTLNSIW